MEAPSGFEPLNRSFADCSLSHLGTAPFRAHYKKSIFSCTRENLAFSFFSPQKVGIITDEATREALWRQIVSGLRKDLPLGIDEWKRHQASYEH